MVKILTNGFPNGFPDDFCSLLRTYINKGMNFVFVASEFENIYEKTDRYCRHFLKMFSDCGIVFNDVKVIDGRISKEEAQDIVKSADVLWLAGGDTPVQFAYLQSYGLIPYIGGLQSVIIGMSAGAINMGKKAVCTVTCGHDELEIYEALGLVEFSVEPHFDIDNMTEELIGVSSKYPLYGICDNGAIICTQNDTLYQGDVFLMNNGRVSKV